MLPRQQGPPMQSVEQSAAAACPPQSASSAPSTANQFPTVVIAASELQGQLRDGQVDNPPQQPQQSNPAVSPKYVMVPASSAAGAMSPDSLPGSSSLFSSPLFRISSGNLPTSSPASSSQSFATSLQVESQQEAGAGAEKGASSGKSDSVQPETTDLKGLRSAPLSSSNTIFFGPQPVLLLHSNAGKKQKPQVPIQQFLSNPQQHQHHKQQKQQQQQQEQQCSGLSDTAFCKLTTGVEESNSVLINNPKESPAVVATAALTLTSHLQTTPSNLPAYVMVPVSVVADALRRIPSISGNQTVSSNQSLANSSTLPSSSNNSLITSSTRVSANSCNSFDVLPANLPVRSNQSFGAQPADLLSSNQSFDVQTLDSQSSNQPFGVQPARLPSSNQPFAVQPEDLQISNQSFDAQPAGLPPNNQPFIVQTPDTQSRNQLFGVQPAGSPCSNQSFDPLSLNVHEFHTANERKPVADATNKPLGRIRRLRLLLAHDTAAFQEAKKLLADVQAEVRRATNFTEVVRIV